MPRFMIEHPTEADRPIHVYLRMEGDDVCVMGKDFSGAVSYLVRLNADGTVSRHHYVPSNLGFKLDLVGRIVET